jgi:acyl dehydratase
MAKVISTFAYGDISVGDSASFSISITETLVNDFVRLSGDDNPLHVDEAYARTTPFKGKIVHGMIVGALFSRLVGIHLPGKYALYLSQTLQFREPIRLGEEIFIHGEVLHKTDAVKTIVLRTTARDKTGKKTFVHGEALVKLLR